MNVYFASEYDEHILAHRLEKYIRENVQEQVKYKEYPDSIYIGCEYFYISIDLEDGRRYAHDISEEYNVEVNTGFDIEIYNKVYEKATKIIAHMFTKLLQVQKGDFIVFDECTKKIIWRTDKLYTAVGYMYFPFNELGLMHGKE